MSYIGRQNLGGAYRQLDDISSGFDGSDTTHTMQVNSQNVTVGDVNQIILSLGGVIQKPGTDFTVSGSVLTFTTAPASGTSFFAILLGSDNGGTVTPTDVSVTKAKLADEVDIFAGTSLSAADLGAGIHIKTADSGGSPNSDHDEVVIEGSGNSGISILSGASSNGAIVFGDSGATADGYVNYNHTNRKMELGTAGATQWTLDSSGNLLPAATDHGIYLGVNSATASNLLDDYEEGDWTVGFTTSSGAMTMNSTYKYGKYTKIGNMVTVTGYAIGAGLGSATSSQGVTMTGLPFTVIGENGAYSGLSVSYGEGMNITAGYSVGGYARINYATVPLRLWDTTSGGSALLQSELSNTGGIIFSLNYFVS